MPNRSMIERVGSAVLAELVQQGALRQGEQALDLPALSKAIIVAMREPPQRMRVSGEEQVERFDARQGSSYRAAHNIFIAMMDAALDEPS